MSDSEHLLIKISDCLEPLLDEPGDILYSSVATLVKGELYCMGLNPGGTGGYALSDVIRKLPRQFDNAYLDQEWGDSDRSYKKGKHPLQQNLTSLLDCLGHAPESVFCTNLIFTRSPNDKGARFNERAPLCWGVHQEFIKVVDPDCFIVFGNSEVSPFNFLVRRFGLSLLDKKESGHGVWKCYLSAGEIEGRQRKVIGVPHLSRYHIRYHEDVMAWIKSKLK